jgi:hypothetical protein
MSAISLTPAMLLGGLGGLVVLFSVWRAGARRARAAADAARHGARLVSLAGRVLLNAGLIVAVQWVVITHGGRGWLLLGVLVLPALFASHAVTRALTITTEDVPRRRGGGRR